MGFFSSLFGGKKQTPEDIQKQKEKNFDILKFDGVKAQRMGQIPYSIKCFTEALALKDDFSTRLYLANSYSAIQEYPLAFEQLSKMAEMDPENIETFLTMAKVSDQLKNWQAMNDACQKAFLLDDKRPEIFYYFGKACYGLEDEISAIAMLTKAITLDGNNKDAYLLRSEILTNMKQYKEAEEDIDKLLEMDEEDETYLIKKARLRGVGGNLEDAIEYYKKIVEINPFNEPAILEMGQTLALQKKFDEALELFNEAIENKPDFADAYKERGNIKNQMGDKDGALADLKKALELAPAEGANIDGTYTNWEQEMNDRYKAINPFA